MGFNWPLARLHHVCPASLFGHQLVLSLAIKVSALCLSSLSVWPLTGASTGLLIPPQIRAEGAGAAAPGVTTAEAHMLFKAETLPLVSQLAAQMMGSAKPTELEIPLLAAELMARGVTVCGIESGTGR